MGLNFVKSDLFNSDVVDHKFLSRKNGFSEGVYESLSFASVDPCAKQNIGLVANEFAVDQNLLKTVVQVHCDDVVVLDSLDQKTSDIKADALVTKIPGLVLSVVTADCCPILFVDEVNRVIGAAHAGWRGALSKIIDNTIDAMCSIGAQKKDIKAVLGPCIAQESYEVDSVFKDAFLSQHDVNQQFFIQSNRDNHFMFNLPGYVERRLRSYGINHVASMNIDTYANEDMFFSCRRATHRKEQGFGLQMSAIKLLAT